MTEHFKPATDELRRLCWTEDNRLQAVQDYNIGAYYGYDSQGERGLKLTGPSIQINQNGYIYHVSALKEQTLYASPLITINDKGYTKHYFEEGKRICSKIGSGELRDINDLVGHMEMNYEEQLTTQYEGIKDGNRGCIGGGWFDLENNNLYKSIIQPYEGTINPGEPIFYYHSDHLGSASFLTDTNGIETQQLVYLPFGEDWVDMKYNTGQYDTPYKFNGKEKDEETGYNNYGARYYYDWATVWLSVDPNSDNYPHATSYAYCNNNPVMLIDPDGRDWYEVENKDTQKKEVKWTDYKSQADMDKNKIEGSYLGEAFVHFEGSKDEKLGEGDNLYGKGAILADVTVYGHESADDIKKYKGYTMSSDPDKFGVVADGDYTVNRLGKNDRKGPYNSDLVVESRSAKIPARGGINPAYPKRKPGYLEGVFIHRSNNNGWAGVKGNQAVSKGCPLITPKDWTGFSKQLEKVNSFRLRITRN